MKKLSILILSVLLAIGCRTDKTEVEELQFLAEKTQAQINTYTLNESPTIDNDQFLGMNDPDGSWAVNRYAISDIFDLFLSDGFTVDYYVYDDVLSCYGELSQFCFVYDQLADNQLELRTNDPLDMTCDMQNAGAGDFVLRVNGNQVLDEGDTVAVTGRGNIFVTGTETPTLSYGRQTVTYAASQTLTSLECRGYVIYATGAATLTLNSIALGHEAWIYTVGATAVSVAPNAIDKIYLNGTALDDDDKITNTSTAGDWAHLTYLDGDGWYARTSTGWSDGGAGGGATNYALGANCMGAWRMNAANNETDISGEDGTLVETSGDIPTSVTVPPGYSGTSRDFGGIADTEYLAHAKDLSTDISGVDQHITVAAWIKVESSTTDMPIFNKYVSPGDQRQYRFRTESSDGSINFLLSSAGTSADGIATGATDVTGGGWFHVAGVYNDTDIRVYVNGVLDSNGADNPKAFTAGIYGSTAPFWIGAGVGEYFDGLIDQPIIFDRALSAAEILDLYNDGNEGEKGGND
jgi:hypothetical protein